MWKGLTLFAANEMGGAVRRRVMAFGFYLFAVVMALMALIYALNAAHTWLSMQYSAIQASLMIAGALALVALILAGIGLYQKSRAIPSTLGSTAMVAAPLAASIVGRKMNFGSAIVVATLVAGAVLGRRIAKS